jgi:hypothetical protein
MDLVDLSCYEVPLLLPGYVGMWSVVPKVPVRGAPVPMLQWLRWVCALAGVSPRNPYAVVGDAPLVLYVVAGYHMPAPPLGFLRPNVTMPLAPAPAGCLSFAAPLPSASVSRARARIIVVYVAVQPELRDWDATRNHGIFSVFGTTRIDFVQITPVSDAPFVLSEASLSSFWGDTAALFADLAACDPAVFVLVTSAPRACAFVLGMVARDTLAKGRTLYVGDLVGATRVGAKHVGGEYVLYTL